ncbi:MAG: hypothetical protein ACE5D0_09925 [Fidelibacterota bacterium]
MTEKDQRCHITREVKTEAVELNLRSPNSDVYDQSYYSTGKVNTKPLESIPRDQAIYMIQSVFMVRERP